MFHIRNKTSKTQRHIILLDIHFVRLPFQIQIMAKMLEAKKFCANNKKAHAVLLYPIDSARGICRFSNTFILAIHHIYACSDSKVSLLPFRMCN